MAKLTKPARDRISATKFAFPKQRKEPLENASHVRNAVARFKQVKDVTDAERRAAWKRIRSAAKRYGVNLEDSDKHECATLHAFDGSWRETTMDPWPRHHVGNTSWLGQRMHDPARQTGQCLKSIFACSRQARNGFSLPILELIIYQ